MGFLFALLSISFAWIVWLLVALLCFFYVCPSVVGRFLWAELHVGFWDAPKPSGILIGFVKIQGF